MLNQSTYAGLTAESILAYSGVSIPPDKIDIQLAASNSFYGGLVRLPALVTFNSLLNGQCRDLQTYCQERLIEYILSGIEEKMTSDVAIQLKDQIEQERMALISAGELLSDLESRHYQLMLKVYTLLEKQVQQWEKSIETEVNKLWESIKNYKQDIAPDLKKRLFDLMRTEAVGINIPERVLSLFKIKEQPSPAEKALLQVLIEAEVL